MEVLEDEILAFLLALSFSPTILGKHRPKNIYQITRLSLISHWYFKFFKIFISLNGAIHFHCLGWFWVPLCSEGSDFLIIFGWAPAIACPGTRGCLWHYSRQLLPLSVWISVFPRAVLPDMTVTYDLPHGGELYTEPGEAPGAELSHRQMRRFPKLYFSPCISKQNLNPPSLKKSLKEYAKLSVLKKRCLKITVVGRETERGERERESMSSIMSLWLDCLLHGNKNQITMPGRKGFSENWMGQDSS